MKARQICWA